MNPSLPTFFFLAIMCVRLFFQFSNYAILPLFMKKANGNPLQYSCLENPMDRGVWWATVHRVAKSWTRLSNFTLTFHFHALEKEMATHSSVLAWRIPGTGEPGGLSSLGSHRVRHDWSDLAAAAFVYVLSLYLSYYFQIEIQFLENWDMSQKCFTPPHGAS